MTVKIYYKTALAGESGALDEIDGTLLEDGYLGLVINSTALYVYQLDADSGAAESLPNTISPNTNAGNKRWIRLQTLAEVAATLGTAVGTTVTDSGGYFDGANVEAVLAELGVDMAALSASVGGYTAAIALNTAHRESTLNPHTVTKTQVGLANVTNDAQLKASALVTTVTDNDAVVPSAGAVVDYAIPKTYLETTITNSDVKVPSSGAVIDYVASLTPGNEFKVAVIGDSLSQEGAFLGSWVNIFADLCKQSGFNVNIASFAVGGHTFYKAMTEDAHENGTKTQVEMAIDFEADIVIVGLGINDCIYVNTRTEAQIIQDGVDVRTLLLAGLPSAKIVLMIEAPHNYETLGNDPATLTNVDAVPASHATITYQGQAGCRVNNSTFTGTSVGATNLAKHQMWGAVMDALDTHYDDFFYVNMWKIARMGCYVDLLHPDYEGHYWMALYVMDWFRNNNGFDDLTLDLTNNWWSLDVFYPIAAGATREAYVYGNYRGVNVKTRMANWMFVQRGLEVSLSPSENISGYGYQMITITGADPGASVWYAWDAGNLADTSRDVNTEGFHQAIYTPAELSVNITAGVHKAVTAIKLADNTFDVFEKAITLIAGSPASFIDLSLSGNLSVGGTITSTGLINGVDVFSVASNYGNTVNQDLRTTAAPTFAGAKVNGNITVTGLVDGVDVNAVATNYGNNPGANNVSPTGSPTFSALTVNGNITCSGLVDGVDVNALASNYGNTVNQAVLTTSNVTHNSLTTAGGVVANGGFAGNAGIAGAKIVTREAGGHSLSFAWTGSQIQFYYDNTLIKSL